jgi:phage baseplate assembly protein W
MAVRRSFAIEDGNIGGRTILSARTQSYSDIDLTFKAKPSGDVYKKTNAADVKQAVKNILLTNKNEKPFLMDFGGSLSDYLFELDNDLEIDIMRSRIIETIEIYEPRAQVLDVDLLYAEGSNAVNVTVTFQIVNSSEIISFDLSLTRLR